MAGCVLTIPEAVCVYPSSTERPYVVYRLRSKHPGSTYTSDRRYSEFPAFHGSLRRVACTPECKCEYKKVKFDVGKIWGRARNLKLRLLAERKDGLERYIQRMEAACLCPAHRHAFRQFIEPDCRLLDDIAGADAADAVHTRSIWREVLANKDFSTFAAHGFSMQVFDSAYCRIGDIRDSADSEASRHQLLVHMQESTQPRPRQRRTRRAAKETNQHELRDSIEKPGQEKHMNDLTKARLVHLRGTVQTVAQCLRSTMATDEFPNAAALKKVAQLVDASRAVSGPAVRKAPPSITTDAQVRADSASPASPAYSSVSALSSSTTDSTRTAREGSLAEDDAEDKLIGITVTAPSFRADNLVSLSRLTSSASTASDETSSEASSPKQYLTVPRQRRSDCMDLSKLAKLRRGLRP